MLPVAYVPANAGVAFAVDAASARYPLAGTLAEVERQLDPAHSGHLSRSGLVSIAFVVRVEACLDNQLAVQLRTRPAAVLTASAAQTPGFRRWLEGWGPGACYLLRCAGPRRGAKTE